MLKPIGVRIAERDPACEFKAWHRFRSQCKTIDYALTLTIDHLTGCKVVPYFETAFQSHREAMPCVLCRCPEAGQTGKTIAQYCTL